MIININEVHVNNISNSAAAATQVECTRILFIYHLREVVPFSIRGKEQSHEKKRGVPRSEGEAESLARPNPWKLKQIAPGQQRWLFPDNPWQEPALDSASQG